MANAYFYFIEANLQGSTCSASSSTGPSPEVAARPTPSNQAVTLTWTPSNGSGIAGYCVWRGRASGAEDAYVYVPGAASSLFTDTGKDWTSGTPSRINNTFPTFPQYVFSLQGQGFANSNMIGHVTLTSGRKVLTFTPAWKNIPVCITNDQSSPGASKAIPTTSSLTILGGPTDIVDYLCFGNPH